MAYKSRTAELQQRWREANMTRKKLALNKNTDGDILEYLETITNFQGYIKRLIREDIERGN